MPTYEYECTKCGTITEVFQSITQSALRKLRKGDDARCSCGVSVVRRISTGGGIIFKGSGFYETDYRSDSYKKSEKADKESSSDSKKSDSTNKDSSKKDTKAKATTGESKTATSPKKSKKD
ncbi:zinc ribbon domain-containing protein [bacterium AH-315-J04]|nr:zinc ribbon domain-containing protein [bacterium AH-315-J04]